MMVNAWRAGHKLAWDMARVCRTNMVQEVLATHVVRLRANLLSQELGFFNSLLTSPSSEVTVHCTALLALLAVNNVRSNVVSNLALVRSLTKLDPWVEPHNKYFCC